jgi:hypothetical protein
MSEPNRELLAQQVRLMQVVVLAMAMGVLMLGVIVAVVLRPEVKNDGLMIAYVGLAAAVLCAIAGLTLPRLIAGKQPASVGTYQTKLIVGAAIFEAAAFLNLIAYMLEGQFYSLVAAGILLLLILMHLPTVRSVQDWLESRERRARELEAFGQ